MFLKNIRLLSLDATNTLIKPRRSPADTYAKFARDFGFDWIDEKKIAASFVGAFKKLEVEKPCYGFYGAGSKSWWVDLLRICYGNEIADRPQFPAMADRVFDFYKTKEAWCLTDEKNLDLLRSLSSRGFQIAIISNFDERLYGLLDAFEISEFVDHVVISADVGFQKPELEIFKLVLERCHITDPKTCLHVGDSYRKDYMPAIELRMNALLLTKGDSNVPPSNCIRSISELVRADLN